MGDGSGGGALGAEQRSLSVSRKLGSEKSHGTPSEDEQRGGGGERSCSLFFSHFFAGSRVFSYPLCGPLSGCH